MGTNVFFEIDEDFNEVEIDTDVVNSCSDEATLAEWYASLEDQSFRIRAIVEARQFTGRARDEWLDRVGGKLAFLKIGMRRVETRMLRLGYAVPYPPTLPHVKHQRQLESKIKRLKQLLTEAGIKVVDVEKEAA